MSPHPANAQTTVSRPFLITFSGIDGAGKTTQIEHLSSRLQNQGLRVLRLCFWDHVAVWSEMRAGVGHRTLDAREADGITREAFSPMNNKHVRKWYLTAARWGFYLLDVTRLRRLLASAQIRNADVVIFDRYIYDQIANIYSQSLAARSYSRMLLSLTPRPDLAFVVDASPDAAFARKPEYPLEFVRRNRQNFLQLQELVPQLAVISDAAEDEVRKEIYGHISHSALPERVALGGKSELTTDQTVVQQQTSCRVRNGPTATV
jgi:thymidylate kinase